MVRLVGFEPTTSASAGQRSNPLSYKRLVKLSAFSPQPSALSFQPRGRTDCPRAIVVPRERFEVFFTGSSLESGTVSPSIHELDRLVINVSFGPFLYL